MIHIRSFIDFIGLIMLLIQSCLIMLIIFSCSISVKLKQMTWVSWVDCTEHEVSTKTHKHTIRLRKGCQEALKRSVDCPLSHSSAVLEHVGRHNDSTHFSGAAVDVCGQCEDRNKHIHHQLKALMALTCRPRTHKQADKHHANTG